MQVEQLLAAIHALSTPILSNLTTASTAVSRFNERSLELAQAFADQAAIALENARQKGQMESRLSLAAATREILEGISSSRDDEAPWPPTWIWCWCLSRLRNSRHGWP